MNNMYYFDIIFLDLVREKFEAAHRSSDPTAIKTLDYFMKKKTDHFNNSINTYVCMSLK